jgi:hypothetical protein
VNARVQLPPCVVCARLKEQSFALEESLRTEWLGFEAANIRYQKLVDGIKAHHDDWQRHHDADFKFMETLKPEQVQAYVAALPEGRRGMHMLVTTAAILKLIWEKAKAVIEADKKARR